MGYKKYKVWTCKIVVDENVILPDGFDSPPRSAAREAVENAGVEIIACFSGWDGKLTPTEIEIIEE